LPVREQQAETKRVITLDMGQKLTEDQIIHIRALPLVFYDNAVLYEAQVRRRTGRTGIVTYVRAGDRVLLLNGKSNPIRAFNSGTPPRLDTSTHAAAYLEFFTAGIVGDEGTFRIVDSPSDIAFVSGATSAERSGIARIVSPLQMSSETPDGKWNARGTVRYGNSLFYAIFQLGRTGQVEMSGDEPAAVNQSFLTERFVDGIRILTDFDFQRGQIRARARKAFDEKRWADAVAAQRDLLVFDGKTDAIDDKSRSALQAGDYTSLSWYQLFVHDFAGALSSSEAGVKLLPTDLALQVNRAHALLFTGQTREAEASYRKFLGQTSATQKWEQIVLDDLRALEEGGLSHPDFANIRNMMTPASGR
jgi:hypothetical protein